MTVVVEQRRVWRSRWIASCLPRAEAALRKAPKVVTAIDRVEEISEYRSVMDAAVACLLPELRADLTAFYARCGPPLAERDAAVLARLDARLATVVEEVAQLETEESRVAVLLAVRSHGPT